MRTLITGANGFLGSWLTARLLDEGAWVRVLVHSARESFLPSAMAQERVEGDVTDAKVLERAVQGVDVVFHLAGIRRATERDRFFQVNAKGTRLLCEAMVAAGTRRLVLCGSLAASGPSTPDRPRLESDPFAPEEWYGESKAEAERIAFGYQDRLEVTVARPPRIMGPGDRENLVFFKMVKRGIRLSVTGARRPLTVVDVDDVVDLLLLLARKKEAVGEAFFAAGPETTLEALQDEVAQRLHVHPRTLRLSPRLLRGLAEAADVASRLTGRHLPLNRKLARQMLAPAWTCSGEKAKRLLGFTARRSLSDSMARSTDWYRQAGWF